MSFNYPKLNSVIPSTSKTNNEPWKNINSGKRFIEDFCGTDLPAKTPTSNPQPPFKKVANAVHFNPVSLQQKKTLNSSFVQRNEQRHNIEEVTKVEVKTENSNTTTRRDLKIFSGNVEKFTKANKSLPTHETIYEIFAKIKSIKQGEHTCEKIILLRNDIGPIIQASFYEIDVKLPDLLIGDTVQCFSRCLENGRVHILKIKHIHPEELEFANRLITISNFILNKTKV